MFELVELTTMTVSPNRTMLPPIWVDACDSQRRRKPPFWKTASGPSSVRLGQAPAASSVTRQRPRVHELDESMLEGPALEEDVPAAGAAAQADVGTESIDLPGVAATRVGAPKPNDVAQEQREHGLRGHRPAAYQRRGCPWVGTRVRVVAGSSRRSTGVTVTMTSGSVARRAGR